jgi:hypothetical protein
MPDDEDRQQPEEPERSDPSKPTGRKTQNSYSADPSIPTAWDVAKGYARGFGTDDWVEQSEPVIISGKPNRPENHPNPSGNTSPGASPLDDIVRTLSDPELQEYIQNTTPGEMFNNMFMSEVKRLGVLDIPMPAVSREPEIEFLPWYKRGDEQQKAGVSIVLFFIALAAGCASYIWGLFATKVLFILSFGGGVGSGVWLFNHVRGAKRPLTRGLIVFLIACIILAALIFRPTENSTAVAGVTPQPSLSPLPTTPVGRSGGTVAPQGSLTYKLIHHQPTPLPTTPPTTPPSPATQFFTSPPMVPAKPKVATILGPASTEPNRIALKGSQIVVKPDGQPLDPHLSVRFINSVNAPPVYHVRVWIAPIYYDDLPRGDANFSEFDPEVLGQPVASNEYSVDPGIYVPVYVDGFRPNHKLSGFGVLGIYVYYVYVDSSDVLHEPEPSVFVFIPGLPGFAEYGLKDVFLATWVRNDLLNMGRRSVRYSDMIGEFGERR